MHRILMITMALVLLTLPPGYSLAQQPRPTATPVRPAATPPATPVRPAATAPATVGPANVPATKIAIVNTQAFADDKIGIRRFLSAVKTVEREFQPKQAELQTLQSRIKAIGDEIQKLSGTGSTVVDPKTISAKQDEGEKLQRDLKYRKDQFDADVERRYRELVGPVTLEIGKALDQYASQNGFTMILDISKLAPAILTVNPAVDVTQQFIAEFNTKNP